MAPLFMKKGGKDIINPIELYRQIITLIEIPDGEDKLEIVLLGLQQIADAISEKECDQ